MRAVVRLSGRPFRRFRQLVLGLYMAMIVICVGMVVGPALNDYEISRDSGRALARVTNVSRMRTTVEFQTEEGEFVSPKNGLLYPTGLAPDMRVWVTYSRTDPTLVKVSGRTWVLAFVPTGSVFGTSTLVMLALWWGMSGWEYIRARRRPVIAVAGDH